MPYFIGAKMTLDDDGNREYTERSPVWVRENGVIGFYDHCLILQQDHKITVMETFEEIRQKLRVPQPLADRKKKAARKETEGTGTEADEPVMDLEKIRGEIDKMAEEQKKRAGKILRDAMEAAAEVDRQLSGGE